MMTMSRPQRHNSLEQYFDMDDEFSPYRLEYYRGEIFAMSGGSYEHMRLIKNVSRVLDVLERTGRCEVIPNNMRTAMPSGLYTYADVALVCGGVAFFPGRRDTFTNPVVLVEVLSKSTVDYDRGDKFELYKSIPTFRDYLLIDQYRIDVEHRWRDGDVWQSKHYAKGESFALIGVPLTIAVDALYEDVTIPA